MEKQEMMETEAPVQEGIPSQPQPQETAPVKKQKKERRHPIVVLTALETAGVFFCLFCKMYYVYKDLFRAGDYIPLFITATLLLVALICVLWRVAFRRTHMVPLFALYVFLSIAAFIDAVYCAYVGQLPSIASLKFAGQLNAVGNTVGTLITFKRLCYVLDLPLWLLWGCVARPVISHLVDKHRATHPPVCKPRTLRRRITLVLVAFSALLGTLFTVFAVRCGFTPSYLKNELLLYHLNDFRKVVLSATGLSSLTMSDISGIRPVTQNQLNSDDPLCGSANGMNVIYIQVEAMQDFVINLEYNGQEVTPNINKFLSDSTLNFDHHYYQIGGGNTSDAEFTALNSLYAPYPGTAYTDYTKNDYYGIPFLLKDNGYTGAYAFHAGEPTFWNREEAYPYQGFDDFIGGANEYPADSLIIDLGPSDEDFFRYAVSYLSEKQQPFFSFLVTVSSHHAYCSIPKEYQFLEMLPEDENTLPGNYLQAMRYYDYAFGIFLEELKAAGLYDNTAIVMYGDHFGLANYTPVEHDFVTRVTGRSYNYQEHFNTPLLIHVPGIESATFSIAAGNVDIMPTMLYLLGLKNEGGYMFGQNLLTAESGMVCEYAHVGVGSFFSDEVFFMMPFTGMVENAQAFTIDSWEKVATDDYLVQSQEVTDAYNNCMYLLKNNMVRSVLAQEDDDTGTD